MPPTDTPPPRPRPAWSFPEYTPAGIDLGSPEAVADFDRNQETDPRADDALLDRLGVAAGSRLVDLACGTGSLVVQAARRGAEAHGVDVSAEMLAFSQARAERAGVTTHWHRAGFLDYAHPADRPAEVVTTKSALHQLPEAAVAKPAGEGFTREDFERHVRDEFSTYAWILEGMIERAGFDIVEHAFPQPTYAEYLCRRR